MTASRQGPFGRKLFLSLFGLAALGVGVWLFRSKRGRRSSRRTTGP
jgi:hypothetical protein